MAFGDIGGPVTELVITCETPAEGPVHIMKGDAVALVGRYTATNHIKQPTGILAYIKRLFGFAQHNTNPVVIGAAIASETKPSTAIPVRVKGVNIYHYSGEMSPIDAFRPYMYGMGIVLSSSTPGFVEFSPKGTGKILAFDLDSKTVHVLH